MLWPGFGICSANSTYGFQQGCLNTGTIPNGIVSIALGERAPDPRIRNCLEAWSGERPTWQDSGGDPTPMAGTCQPGSLIREMVPAKPMIQPGILLALCLTVPASASLVNPPSQQAGFVEPLLIAAMSSLRATVRHQPEGAGLRCGGPRVADRPPPEALGLELGCFMGT